MADIKWVICPVCGSKTRATFKSDTFAENLPVFCPKCKNTSYAKIEKNIVTFK